MVWRNCCSLSRHRSPLIWRALMPTTAPRRPASAVLCMQVPEYWGALMCNRIGAGPADKLLKYAKLISPNEALRLGLIDQVTKLGVLAHPSFV